MHYNVLQHEHSAYVLKHLKQIIAELLFRMSWRIFFFSPMRIESSLSESGTENIDFEVENGELQCSNRNTLKLIPLINSHQ